MIHTLTLNPAIDKIFYLDKVKKGITNRIGRETMTVGGKGTHVSMNLSQMGVANQAFGLARGATGRFIVQALETWGVTTRFILSDHGQSRTNYILLENDNTCTTIAEKGPDLTEADLQTLLDFIKQNVQCGDTLVLSGDASNCPDPFVYNNIANMLAKENLSIFLDASGNTLCRGLECSPFLIKPNQDELEALCGFPLDSDDDVLRGIASLDKYDIQVVAVSLGGRGSLVRFGTEYYRATPPKVDAINTVGCGDSYLAALLYGYEKGMAPSDMLRFATAVSAATAMSSLSVGYDNACADALLSKCGVDRIQ